MNADPTRCEIAGAVVIQQSEPDDSGTGQHLAASFEPAQPVVGSICAAEALTAGRQSLRSVDHRELDAETLRRAWLDLHESWLRDRADEIGIRSDSGFALVATGGLGRRELLPYSDLDLMLLHDNKPTPAVEQIAELLWYPLWDANIGLDHSVRTVAETLQVADTDITAGLALLDARHIAGDSRLSAALTDGVRSWWRTGIRSRLDELVDSAHTRWQRCGEIAHRAEPDLKLGRGGLRDVQLLRGLAVAQLADREAFPVRGARAGSLDAAHLALLNVRTELHRASGRERNLLLAQHADAIGAALRVGDRFDLARLLSDAGRTISHHVDTGLRTAFNLLPHSRISSLRRPQRRPLDDGVVEYAGEVVLARDAHPERDAGLVLRVAAAAATAGLPIAADTLRRLSATAEGLRTPWPRETLDDLLVLLAAGPEAVTTIEALDRSGLWGRLFPEWAAVRDLSPRDVIHTWTVDRHLVQTVAEASALTTRVARPDLLLLGALFHDIGKGRNIDHSALGAELAFQIGASLGLCSTDIDMLSTLIRHHLLLVRVATREDLNDPAVIAEVSSALGSDPVLLDVLHALTEADSLATGPSVWGDWKATLVGDLVRRTRLLMASEPLPQAEPIDAEYLALAADRGMHVRLKQGASPRIYRAVMIAPDQRGLLSKAAGVLALNSLSVHAASVNSHDGVAINEFVVSPLFGSPATPELLRLQFVSSLRGDIDVLDMLRDRNSHAPRVAPGSGALVGVPANPVAAAPSVRWVDDAAPGRLIIEVRATDRRGLLALLAGELESLGVEIVWAKVSTFGMTVDDVFCVIPPAERTADTAGFRVEVEKHLFEVLRPTASSPEQVAR